VERSFTTLSAKVGYAQEAGFAKSGPLPDSGPSCKARRMTVESPESLMLRRAGTAAKTYPDLSFT